MTAAIDPEAILESIRARAGVPAAIWLLGWKHLAKNRSPPLYIWYPDTLEDRPPDMGGSVASAWLGFVVQIWGESFYDAFQHYVLLRATLWIELGPGALILRGKWARPGAISKGAGLDMPVVFKIPVTDDLVEIQTVQATEAVFTSGGTPGDSWLELGD